jgi:hypothetical protein
VQRHVRVSQTCSQVNIDDHAAACGRVGKGTTVCLCFGCNFDTCNLPCPSCCPLVFIAEADTKARMMRRCLDRGQVHRIFGTSMSMLAIQPPQNLSVAGPHAAQVQVISWMTQNLLNLLRFSSCNAHRSYLQKSRFAQVVVAF